eukprot:1182599-Prorocentrum_minimum.AAC.6
MAAGGSWIGLLALYRRMLDAKGTEAERRRARLMDGLSKLRRTEMAVTELQVRYTCVTRALAPLVRAAATGLHLCHAHGGGRVRRCYTHVTLRYVCVLQEELEQKQVRVRDRMTHVANLMSTLTEEQHTLEMEQKSMKEEEEHAVNIQVGTLSTPWIAANGDNTVVSIARSCRQHDDVDMI